MTSSATTGQISQAEYARLRGVSRQAVNALVARGVLPLINGKVDIAVADMKLAEHLNPAKSKILAGEKMIASAAVPAMMKPEVETSAAPKYQSYQVAKTVRENLAAQREEIELRKAQGELIEREMVTRALTTAAVMVRDAVLGVPRRVSAELATFTSGREIEERLDRELRNALEMFVRQALTQIGSIEVTH